MKRYCYDGARMPLVAFIIAACMLSTNDAGAEHVRTWSCKSLSNKPEQCAAAEDCSYYRACPLVDGTRPKLTEALLPTLRDSVLTEPRCLRDIPSVAAMAIEAMGGPPTAQSDAEEKHKNCAGYIANSFYLVDGVDVRSEYMQRAQRRGLRAWQKPAAEQIALCQKRCGSPPGKERGSAWRWDPCQKGCLTGVQQGKQVDLTCEQRCIETAEKAAEEKMSSAGYHLSKREKRVTALTAKRETLVSCKVGCTLVEQARPIKKRYSTGRRLYDEMNVLCAREMHQDPSTRRISPSPCISAALGVYGCASTDIPPADQPAFTRACECGRSLRQRGPNLLRQTLTKHSCDSALAASKSSPTGATLWEAKQCFKEKISSTTIRQIFADLTGHLDSLCPEEATSSD